MGFVVSIRFFILFQVVISLATCKFIHMSYVYEEDMITWGTVAKFQLTNEHTGPFAGGSVPFVYYNKMKLSEHTGTHIDAPVHFAKGHMTVDEIPVENLFGPAIVVNISEKASKDRNAQMTVSDLQMWEKDHGRIPDGSILLMFTGWGKYWGNFEEYMGTSNYNATYSSPNDYNFPGIHPDAARWLVNNRKLKGIGLDTRSLDHGQTKDYLSHQILLGNDLFGLESLANLDKLPAKGATLIVMPMKIKNGSGGPTRVVARLDGDVINNCSKTSSIFFALFIILLPLFF